MKFIYLKYYALVLLCCPGVSFCDPGDKEDFIAAWEQIQQNSELVDIFEKTSDGVYHIKFTSLPYDGELHLLTYDVEDLAYMPEDSRYTKTGYVEIDIPNEMNNLMKKYSRTYFKWAENNSLYFDSSSQQWVTQKNYASSLRTEGVSLGDKVVLAIFEYWSYALIGIILYFLWSTIINNKRTKIAIKVQEDMLGKSLADSAESINMQRTAIQQSAELHKETNKILLAILREVKSKKE